MSKLDIQTFRFRCMNGDIVAVPAGDERAARAIVMEKRWGPPQYNLTWACSEWRGEGLSLVDEEGLPVNV